MIKLNDMDKIKYIFIWLSAAAILTGCSGSDYDYEPDAPAAPRAISFAGSLGMAGEDAPSRASSLVRFEPGDKIIVYATHTDNLADNSFYANFMKDQIVEYGTAGWTYSPIKYWPQNGKLTFRGYYPSNVGVDGDYMLNTTHKCVTGFERLYKAQAEVYASDDALTGDVSADGMLQLAFKPVLNTINFTAKVEDNLFHEVPSDEYVNCHFLLLTFQLHGFYKEATYSMADNAWTPTDTDLQYTKSAPLDMTPYLAKKNVEATLPGYIYNPKEGYFTESAVIVGQGDGKVNIFDNTLHLIPRDNASCPPGIEVTYVVLTNKTDGEGNNVYKESGIITRVISLSKILNTTGLIQKQININLDFSIDAVTVTRNLEDYTYKPFF